MTTTIVYDNKSTVTLEGTNSAPASLKIGHFKIEDYGDQFGHVEDTYRLSNNHEHILDGGQSTKFVDEIPGVESISYSKPAERK